MAIPDAATVAEWRQKALDGTISTDEMRAWIEQVRGSRRSAAVTSAKSRAKKEPVNVDSLLDDIDNL